MLSCGSGSRFDIFFISDAQLHQTKTGARHSPLNVSLTQANQRKLKWLDFYIRVIRCYEIIGWKQGWKIKLKKGLAESAKPF